MGASGEVFTVTVAVAWVVPPDPVAVNVYVVVLLGVTFFEALKSTLPIPWMLTLVALVVFQVSVLDCPGSTAVGLAEKVTVGASGVG